LSGGLAGRDAVISLLLPTRGRPAWVARLFDSLLRQTRRVDRLEIVLYIDDDDLPSHALDEPRLHVEKIIGPRLTMGGYNSACLGRSSGDVVMLANDDIVARTSEWDEKVRALDRRYPDGIYLGYGNDLLQGKNLCTFPILSRRTCEILVEPFPRAYHASFIDYHLLDIFKRLQHAGHDRICYLEDLVFEHMHYQAGKAEFDATYRKRSPFIDDPVFLALAAARAAAAEQLCNAIEGESVVPAAPKASAGVDPRSLPRALIEYGAVIFSDRGLPWGWRLFLYTWFVRRYLASRLHHSAGPEAI